MTGNADPLAAAETAVIFLALECNTLEVGSPLWNAVKALRNLRDAQERKRHDARS
jgi:hypothetical protein